MGLDVKTIKQYNNGYSQLEVLQKNRASSYYYLPSENIKKFSESLKEHNRKSNVNSNIALGASAFIGVLGANAFTKNKSKVVDLTAKFITAVTLAGISGFFVNDYNSKTYSKLLQKYQAKELTQIT